MSGKQREVGNGTGEAGASSPPGRTVTRLVLLVRGLIVDFISTPGRLSQFLRYLSVSVLALGVDLGAFWVFIEMGGLDAVVAGAASVMVGLVAHYALSSLFVFADQETGKSQARLISEYALTGGVGVIMTAGVMFVAVNMIGLPGSLAKGAAVGVTFLAVYVMRARFVFRADAPAKPVLSTAGLRGSGT